MAVSINACIKLSPPPNPSSPLAKPAISPWSTSREREREAWWRSRCVSTAAILIIGTTTGFAVGDAEAGLAGGVPSYVERPRPEGKVAMRWSDKRKCPPWHVNSLENVVPENLPRPSDRRRSGGFVAYDQTAPMIGGSCFSM